MRKWLAPLAILTLSLLACNLSRFAPASKPVLSQAEGRGTDAIETLVAAGMAGTQTAAASAIVAQPSSTLKPTTSAESPTSTATKPSPSGTPSPVASTATLAAPTAAKPTATRRPSATATRLVTLADLPPAAPPKSVLNPKATYTLSDERVVGVYAVRRWRNSAKDAPQYDQILTIAGNGQTMAHIEWVAEVDALSGSDIIGEGNPDIIAHTYSGGAHCCSTTVIYDLGEKLRRVLSSLDSNCTGRLEDLDGDGAYEFITCDDSFAYAYCCYAGSPLPHVIMVYDPLLGVYGPDSPSFDWYYDDLIAEHTQKAQKAKAGDGCEMDNTTKCSVLAVVLDYLYAGRLDEGWSELYRLYPYPDVEEFRTDIEGHLDQSALFVVY